MRVDLWWCEGCYKWAPDRHDKTAPPSIVRVRRRLAKLVWRVSGVLSGVAHFIEYGNRSDDEPACHAPPGYKQTGRLAESDQVEVRS